MSYLKKRTSASDCLRGYFYDGDMLSVNMGSGFSDGKVIDDVAIWTSPAGGIYEIDIHRIGLFVKDVANG